jgi:hypothetical protein
MWYIILIIAGLALIAVAGYFLYIAFQLLGFNVLLFVDNLLMVQPSIKPLYAWLLFGAVMGAFVGLWKAAARNRVSSLKPVACIGPIIVILTLGYLTDPMSYGDTHRSVREQPAAVSPPAPMRVQYVIAPAGANIRAAPSTNSERLAALPRGTPVTVLSEHGDWYGVQYGSAQNVRTGFIHKSLVGTHKPEQE